MVGQERACDRILDGSNAHQRVILFEAGKELLETQAGDHLDRLPAKIVMRRRLVETTRYALYGYPFHRYIKKILLQIS